MSISPTSTHHRFIPTFVGEGNSPLPKEAREHLLDIPASEKSKSKSTTFSETLPPCDEARVVYRGRVRGGRPLYKRGDVLDKGVKAIKSNQDRQQRLIDTHIPAGSGKKHMTPDSDVDTSLTHGQDFKYSHSVSHADD